MLKLEIAHEAPRQSSKPTPLLFLHGILHAAWAWEKFLPYFAQQGYHSYAVSLRGHGRSELNGRLRWQRAHDYVEDLAQTADLIASERGQRPVVIGHSMGGLVVQKYLENHEDPAGILLSSVPPHGVYRTTLRIFRLMPLKFLRMNLTMDLKLLVDSVANTRWFGFGADLPDETIKAYHARMGDESFLIFLDMLALALPRPSRVKTPMLVLGGELDSIFQPDEIEATAKAYGSEYEIFTGQGHDLMLDSRWQEVADRILVWLDQRGL